MKITHVEFHDEPVGLTLVQIIRVQLADDVAFQLRLTGVTWDYLNQGLKNAPFGRGHAHVVWIDPGVKVRDVLPQVSEADQKNILAHEAVLNQRHSVRQIAQVLRVDGWDHFCAEMDGYSARAKQLRECCERAVTRSRQPLPA